MHVACPVEKTTNKHSVTTVFIDTGTTDFMDANTIEYKQQENQGESSKSALSQSDNSLQNRLLQGVSRTFALTIPVLPVGLREPVSNGYLLCRIIDTIEDDPALNLQQKSKFSSQFNRVVTGEEPAEKFASELAKILSDVTTPAENELIQLTPAVIGITHSFNKQQREALSTCVQIMAEGMLHFQEKDSSAGLADMAEMEHYCYVVAGVVGEMLTKLFCDYSPDIAINKQKMMDLSKHFGQGLQMTNILKDIWDDKERGACWLPQSIFDDQGFDLKNLTPGQQSIEFERGLERLIAIAQNQLSDALQYTVLIPRNETGIRNFCLWALGMAVLTIRKLNKHKDFSDGKQVKITRRSVKMTVLTSRIAASHDQLLQVLFRLASLGLPKNSTQNN